MPNFWHMLLPPTADRLKYWHLAATCSPPRVAPSRSVLPSQTRIASGQELEMADQPGDSLRRRDRQIMEIVFARGQATALEVVDALLDPPTKTAIRTLLRILEEKGHLKHIQRGREFVYQPTQPRGRAARS